MQMNSVSKESYRAFFFLGLRPVAPDTMKACGDAALSYELVAGIEDPL